MPIRQTVLEGSGLRVSRVSMGLSHLHRMKSSYDRDRLIGRQGLWELRILTRRRFMGMAWPRELWNLAATLSVRSDDRYQIRVAAEPLDWELRSFCLAFPCRAFGAPSVWVVRWPKRCFLVTLFQNSLAASLKALKTDYIDICFLHEPTLADMEGNLGLLDGLIKAKEVGKIRAIGIAGPDVDQLSLGLEA